MVNKIDTSNLETHIGELESLYQSWCICKNIPSDTSGCGGQTVTQMETMATSLQALQDGFTTLVNNTVSYMRQRKESVDTKEASAASEVGK